MTPKERVLAKRPDAHCQGYAGKRFISFHIKDGPELLGIGDSSRGAWRDAAAHLRRVSTSSKP